MFAPTNRVVNGPAVLLFIAACACFSLPAQQATPGSRTIMDAHNCYPYGEWWSDRIDRALSTGTPVAIEQDLSWHRDATTGRSWSVLTHGEPTTGDEPVMEQYFFEKVRPIVENALRNGNRGDWPLITLNLDFKDNKPEHLAAVLALLRKYQPWLTTAVKTANPAAVGPLDLKPILVLTGEADAQQAVFYDQLQAGEKLLVFGAVHSGGKDRTAAPGSARRGEGHQLQALVEQPMERSRGGRPASCGRVDPGKDGPPSRAG